jgi:hypothetical protein
MASHKNARHEKFAHNIAKGMSAAAAYVEAGYKPSRQHGARLATKGDITARVAELVAPAIAETEVTVERILQEMTRLAFYDATLILDVENGGMRDPVSLPEDLRRAIVAIKPVQTEEGLHYECLSPTSKRRSIRWPGTCNCSRARWSSRTCSGSSTKWMMMSLIDALPNWNRPSRTRKRLVLRQKKTRRLFTDRIAQRATYSDADSEAPLDTEAPLHPRWPARCGGMSKSRTMRGPARDSPNMKRVAYLPAPLMAARILVSLLGCRMLGGFCCKTRP